MYFNEIKLLLERTNLLLLLVLRNQSTYWFDIKTCGYVTTHCLVEYWLIQEMQERAVRVWTTPHEPVELLKVTVTARSLVPYSQHVTYSNAAAAVSSVSSLLYCRFSTRCWWQVESSRNNHQDDDQKPARPIPDRQVITGLTLRDPISQSAYKWIGQSWWSIKFLEGHKVFETSWLNKSKPWRSLLGKILCWNSLLRRTYRCLPTLETV